MQKVTLRFYVQSITENAGGSHTLTMAPDYAHGANAEWSKYTPAGLINLNLSTEASINFYREALRNHSTVAIEMSVIPA